MKLRHPWGKLAVLLSLVLIAAVAVPATLAYVVVQTPSLQNVFTADAPAEGELAVDVRVHKTVLAAGQQTIGPEGFHFLLTDAQTGASHAFATGYTGYGTLTLAYSLADAGKTYAYRLTEVNDAREHVTYSDLSYDLTITLAEESGALTAALTMNGEPVTAILAEFENIYAPTSDVPATGDDAPLLMWMLGLLLCGAGLILLRPRVRR